MATTDLDSAPSWFRAAHERFPTAPEELRLLVLHWDKHPTAIDVYTRCLPHMGHQIVFLEREYGDATAYRVREEGKLTHVSCVSPRPSTGGPKWLRVLRNRPVKLLGFFSKWLYVCKLARRLRVDAIQARDNTTEAFIAWSVAFVLRVPFAFQLDYWHPEAARYAASLSAKSRWWLRLKTGWQIALREWLIRRAVLFFPISDAMRDVYLGRGVAAERMQVFPVGLTASFALGGEPPAAIRERLGLGRRPVVAYLGNLNPLRKPEQLFEILAGVQKGSPEVAFLILTRTPEIAREQLRTHAIDESRVRILDLPHAEVASVLRIADVGLFPLAEEDPYGIIHVASPLKVVEYMACGVVPVSSANPEAVELFAKSGCGIVSEDRPEAFAQATLDLIGDRQRLAAMGERGRDYVLRFKSCDAIAGAIVRAYSSLPRRRMAAQD